MNRLASVRVGALFAAVVVSSVTGCNCDPPDDCSDLVIDTTPANDATDVNQVVDVVANFRRGPMTSVAIATAKIQVRAAGDADFGAAADGMISNATATFAGRMFKAGQNTFKVTLTEKDSTCAVSRDVSITVKETVMAPPVVMAVEFPQDADRNGTLNSSELPSGTALAVRVRTTAGSGAGAKATLRDGSGTQVGGEVDVMSDVANFMLPAPVGDSLGINLTARATRGTQTSADVMGAIQIRRAVPMCSNTSPDTVGPNNDADPGTAGFQLGLLGTVGGTVTAARFEATPGNLTAMGTVMGGMVAGIVTIPNMGSVTYSTTLIATDTFGNECRSAKMVRANFQAPTLTVTSPTNPDGGAVDIAQTPLRVTVSTMGLPDGRQVCVDAQIGAGMPVQVGCGNVMNLTTDGATTFIVSATDAVGNRGETRFTGNVTLEGCVPAFDPQLSCPNTYLTQSNTANGSFAFIGSARTRCAGQAARLFIGTSTTPAATTTVSPSGALTFAATTLTSGTTSARIEVDRQGGGMPHTVSCADIVVDLNRPAITNPAAGTPPPFVINLQQDLQPAVAGAQRVLAYTGAIPTGGTAIACMNQMTGSSSTACPGNTGFFIMNPSTGVGASPAQGFTFPEGEYDVVVVLRRGNGLNSSTPVAVRVDVTPPCVAMNGFTLPQDTAPMGGDGRLNVAELGGMNPRVSVTLDPACADRAGAPATTIAVRELNGGVAGATRATGTGTPGTASTLTISAPASTVENLTLFAEATDWVGNRNSAAGAANLAVRTLGLYPSAPACSVVNPTTGAQLNGNDVSGGITAQVNTAGNGVVGTNGVQFTLTRGANPAVVQTATPNGSGQATTSFTTADGSYSLTARCTDVALNQTTSSAVTFAVDATPPQGCAVTSPLAGSTATATVIPTTVTTTSSETGATVTVTSTGGTVAPASFALTGTSVTQNITYPLGTQNLTVRVADSFNNSCTVQVANVSVTSTTCVFTVNKGFVNTRTWLNKTAQGDTTITINSPNCRSGQTARLTRTAPTPGAPVTSTTSASGDAVFAVTPADGETYTAVINNGTVDGPVTTIGVDFADPVVPAGAFTVAGAAPTVGDLKFVAAAGNPRVAGGPLATPGYYPDTNPGAQGAQIDLAVNGITGATQAGENGRVVVAFGPATVATDVLSASPASPNFGSAVTFPHPTRTAVALTVRVSDQANNTVSAFTGQGQVDVIAPANPAAVLGTVTRGGTVNLNWTTVFDDLTDTASGAAVYDIRWTTSSVIPASTLADEAQFFSTTRARKEPDISGMTSATLRLPPFTDYFIGVRARDSLDNYSAFPSILTRSNSPLVSTISDSTGTGFGQLVSAASDLTGDGVRDVVVSAPNTSTNLGAVYVFRGGTGLNADQTACGTSTSGCQRLTPPDGLTGNFGTDFSTGGNVGEVGDDLVVGQPGFQSQGRAFLFFGNTDGGQIGTTPGEFIEFRSNAQNTFFGQSAKILKDVNGDGLDEVMIFSVGADATNADTSLRGVGRAYIYFGRSRAGWLDGGTQWPVSQANVAIEGPSPKVPPGTTSNGFGSSRLGFASLGKPVAASGGNDFAIGISRQFLNRVQLWSAGTVSSASVTLSSGQALQTLTQPPVADSSTSGFGAAIVSGTKVLRGGTAGLNDLLVSWPVGNQLLVYQGVTRTGTMGSPVTIAGPNTFGVSAAVGLLADDGAPSLAVGEGGTRPTGLWILSQAPGGSFESLPTTLPLTSSGFWSVRFPGCFGGVANCTAANSFFGNAVSSSDVTGDGVVDVVAADNGNTMVRILR
jgi:large repetitive protein